MNRFGKFCLAMTMTAFLAQTSVVPAAFAKAGNRPKLPDVTAQPNVGQDIAPYFNNPAIDAADAGSQKTPSVEATSL